MERLEFLKKAHGGSNSYFFIFAFCIFYNFPVVGTEELPFPMRQETTLGWLCTT